MKLKEEDVNSVLNFKKKERHRCNLPWVRPLTSHIFLIFAIVKGNFVIHSLLFKSEHKYYDVLLHLFSDLSACTDKAHWEGKVNRDDRTIKVRIQLILITLFIIILCSNNKDLGETRIRRILHIALVSNKTRNSNPTRMQDSRRISRHSNRTTKLHDRPHHLQIRFWVRSLS